MKNYIIALLIILVMEGTVYSQAIDTNKFGLGFNLGGLKLYGDVKHTGFGMLFEPYLKYKLNNKFSTVLALSYGEVSDGTFRIDKQSFLTDIISMDVRGAYCLLPENRFQPNVYAGLGIFNFKNDRMNLRHFDASLFFGGGLEYFINSQLSLASFADYRFTTCDDLDIPTPYGAAKDGYLSVRGGVAYHLQSDGGSYPKVLAEGERIPIEELDGESDDELSALIEGIDNFEEASSSDYTMDEYIKLKSRLDDLSDNIQHKELEIDELQAQLNSRQDRVAELEQNIRGKGGALAASLDIDNSDFSANYEQALENYYAHEYDAAIYIFNTIINNYPTHKMASNCQYWISESYFGKQDYDKALEGFQAVIDYRQSSKKDDALLMMGRCYVKMGNRQMATEMFNQLLDEYPDSEYLHKAESYMNTL